MTAARPALLALYRAALERVHGTRIAREALADLTGDCAVLAVGKAAVAMAEGAIAAPGISVVTGFVGAPRGYGVFAARDGWQVHYGGHPVPDLASLVAGRAMVEWMEALPTGLPLAVLVSGGSSACIEVLREGMSLDEVVHRTEMLTAAGADIRALNAARSEWSMLKQGRALRHAGTREVTVHIISDVPGDDPAFVGSGAFWSPALKERLRVVASNDLALDAAGVAAHDLGLTVRQRRSLTGDAAKQGIAIARMLRDAEPGVYLWGGETTVALPDAPERGGRCQHLALAAAEAIAGADDVAILAAGTDGIDGASRDAGAVVDGGTLARMQVEGVDAGAALAAAASNRALAASGDLVNTGPTGTNVMDIVIGLKS